MIPAIIMLVLRVSYVAKTSIYVSVSTFTVVRNVVLLGWVSNIKQIIAGAHMARERPPPAPSAPEVVLSKPVITKGLDIRAFSPLPLTASQEQQVRDIYYKNVRVKCDPEIRGKPATFQKLDKTAC